MKCRDMLRMSRHVPPPFLMLPRCMTLRNSLVPRSVRAIRVSRRSFESSAIRPRRIFLKWRHSRNRPGRLGTRLIKEYSNMKPSNAVLITWSVHQMWSVRTSGHLSWQKSRNLSLVMTLSQLSFQKLSNVFWHLPCILAFLLSPNLYSVEYATATI